jgi:general nucleoside transport system permease protein
MKLLAALTSGAFLTVLLGSGLRASVPLLLGALGETYAERAGILNLGIEGMMLIGAFGSFYVALNTGDLLLGLLAGVGLGVVLGLIVGALAITLRVDQIVLGLGVTIFGSGLTAFLFRHFYGARFPTLDVAFHVVRLPLLSGLPVVGPALFAQQGLVYASLALVAVFDVALYRTHIGLDIRAVGENPFAADAAGVDVFRIRYLAITLAGAMAGFAGAFISVADLGFFVPGVTAGRGFIAIAIAMLGRWDPYRVVLGALLFGLMQSLANGLQVIGLSISPDFILMLPYVGIMVVLALLARHAVLPAALAIPYQRGEH